MVSSASAAAEEQEKKRAEAEAARLEAARPASEKRKPKKSVSFSSGRESKPGGIRADPPVSALSYNPSMDFLNAVEKPSEKRQQSESEKAFKSLFDF
jgi:hypothetical protein